MKLLLDQGLPRSAVGALSRLGLDAVHCADVELSTALNEEILAVARTEELVVVTLDADFHALLATSGSRLPSVVRILVEGLEGAPGRRHVV